MNILILLGYIILVAFAFTAVSFAPWVPTKKRDIARAIKLSGLRSGEIFYDLGCGDGRLIFEAEKTGAHAIGVELFFPLYFVCLLKKYILRSPSTFKCKSLFKENLSEADVIFLFGTPQTLKKTLTDKLAQELKSGTRVVSYVFPIDGWTPEMADKWDRGDELSIFVYQKK